MIIYQGNIQVEFKSITLSFKLIGDLIYTIVMFNLSAIIMFVANLNLLDKNSKDGYNCYHHLNKDGEIFFLIM